MAHPHVTYVLRSLAEDAAFQEDLADPLCRSAIEHWTGVRRLPVAEAEATFLDNYRVSAMLHKFRALQQACREASACVQPSAALSATR